MTIINFARPLGAKDKTKRKKRNLLATGAKVLGGAAALGLVGGTIYTGNKIGKISKALSRGNAAGFDEFKKSPEFVKHVYGKYLDTMEGLGSTIAKDSTNPAAGLGISIRDGIRRQKLKLRKGFLESTQLDQKINAQRAAIQHTKVGDLANQSDEFKKAVVDKQRKARQATRSSGDLTRRMEDEVGKYFSKTTGTSGGRRRRINPMILNPGYTATPRIGRRKKFLGLFNMYMMGDYAEFARKRGSKDKKPRRPSIRRGALIGGGVYGGLNALTAAAQMKNPLIREATGIPKGLGKAYVASALIAGGLLGAGVGAGINAIRKRMYDNKYGKLN